MPDAHESSVRAAGGVLWRREGGVLQVAVVHRPKYDDWSLPKGKLERGEHPLLGGLREVWEETGFTAVPGRTLGVSRYRVLHRGRDVPKTVRWWAMRAAEGEFSPTAEVDALRWLPLPAALARVTSGHDTAPLTAFAHGAADTTSVLLVRHGSAGDRAGWRGPDEERPLDRRGEEQALALADLLPAFRPERVLSAPLVRCTATVQPLAERLELEVERAPEAAEDHAAGALAQLLVELGSKGQAVVVCSQGGVIPAAVAQLTGRPAEEVPAPKGSLWALSFDGERVVDAAPGHEEHSAG